MYKKRGRPKKYHNSKCRNLYMSQNRKEIRVIEYELFLSWYENHVKSCDYCGISESDAEKLFIAFPDSTRGGKRGRTLELDRKNPLLKYGEDINNFALACYWCNNAKSNYFTVEEFSKIAIQIGKVNQLPSLHPKL